MVENNISESKYIKIITERVYTTLSDITSVAYTSRVFEKNSSVIGYKNNQKDRSVIVDMLSDGKRICLSLYVVIFYSIDKTIPEIVYEIQQRVKKDIEDLVDYKIKSIDVTIVGIIFK